MATVVDTYPDRDTNPDVARDRLSPDLPGCIVTDSSVAVVAAQTAMTEFRADHASFSADELDDADGPDTAESVTQTGPSVQTRRALAAPALAAGAGSDRSAAVPSERATGTNVDQDRTPELATGSSDGGKGIGETPGGAVGEGGEENDDPWKLPENFSRDHRVSLGRNDGYSGRSPATEVTVIDNNIAKTGIDSETLLPRYGRRVSAEASLNNPHTGRRIIHARTVIDFALDSGDAAGEALANPVTTNPEALARHVAAEVVASLDGMIRPNRSVDKGDTNSSPADTPQEISPDPEGTIRISNEHAKELAVAAGPAEERDRDGRMVVDRALLNSALIAAGADSPSISLTVDQYTELLKVAAGGYLPLLTRAGDAPETITPDEHGLLDQALSYVRTPEAASVVRAIYGLDAPPRKVAELARERSHAQPLVSQALARGLYDFQYVTPQIVTDTFDPQAWQRIHRTIRSPFGLAIALGESIPANATTETARGLALEALKGSRIFPGDEAAIVADLWGLTGNPPMGRAAVAEKVQQRAGFGTDTDRHALVVADVAVRLMKLLTGEGDGTR